MLFSTTECKSKHCAMNRVVINDRIINRNASGNTFYVYISFVGCVCTLFGEKVMRIFNKGEGSYESVVNFVDENNVLVGYDTNQDCCEHAGWRIKESLTPYSYKDNTPENETSLDLSQYSFDIEFFESLDGGDLDAGRMVIFKLIAPNLDDLFLHLFNAHNGYYSHGFVLESDGTNIKDEYL